MSESENEATVWHDPRKDSSLSDAVLSALEAAKDEELTKAECVLFDDIDPEALDTLFQGEGGGKTSVLFNTPTAGIRIEPGSEIEIRVAALRNE